MKTNRILAVALSAGLVLGGSLSVSHAEDAKGYATEAEAKAAAEADLKKNTGNNSFDIVTGADGKYYYSLKFNHEKAIAADDLKEYKEEIIKANGITSEWLKKQIMSAKTKEGAQALVKEIKKDKFKEVEKKEAEKEDTGIYKPYVTEKFYSKEAAKEAAYTEKKNIELEGLSESYDVEIYEQKNADGTVNYYIRRVLKENKPEVKPTPDKKPDVKPTPDKKPEVKPAPSYDYEYPLIKPGKVDEEVTLPKLEESKEVEKEAKEKETTEVKEKSKAKENKKKVVEAENKKQAPARQAGRKNPKTGLESVAPVLSTLAISMAGIVATRKKNN